MKILLSLLLCFVVQSTLANTIASFKILKGSEKNSAISEGSLIRTLEEDVLQIVLTDKSEITIGQNSEMRIENSGESGIRIIELFKGKVRVLGKSKLFIKTSNSVTIVEKADLLVSANIHNTSSVVFSGDAIFHKFIEKDVNPERLEQNLEDGVRIASGEFSVTENNRSQPTVSSILNVQQREALERNYFFDQDNEESVSTNSSKNRSVVPQGLSGEIVANDNLIINEEVRQITGTEVTKKEKPIVDMNGFERGSKLKPANGSVLDIHSGQIYGPSNRSVLDRNTNSYSAGENIIITKSGNISFKGKKELVPTPIIKERASRMISLDSQQSYTHNQDIILNPNGLGTFSTTTMKSGGIQNVNEAAQQIRATRE